MDKAGSSHRAGLVPTWLERLGVDDEGATRNVTRPYRVPKPGPAAGHPAATSEMGADRQVTEELETHAGLDVVSLDDLAESLIADLPNHRSGKTAKTIMSGTVMRAVIVA